MDKIDEKILKLIEHNGRMSYQAIGDAVGMSRVAARKRMDKLERSGVIEGYRTVICREDDCVVFISIDIIPSHMEEVVDYLSGLGSIVKRIMVTAKKSYSIHVEAVSESPEELKDLAIRIDNDCCDFIKDTKIIGVKEIVRDSYRRVEGE